MPENMQLKPPILDFKEMCGTVHTDTEMNYYQYV